MSALVSTKKGDLLFEQYNFPLGHDYAFAVGCYYVKNGMKKGWHVYFSEDARPINFEAMFDNLNEGYKEQSEDFRAGAFFAMLQIRKENL